MGVPWSFSNLKFKRTLGNTNRTLQSVLDDLGCYPEHFGAKGDGSTDDTGAIQLAANAADTVKGTLVFNYGKTFYATDTLTFLCHVKGDKATLKFGAGVGKTNYNKTAVQLGNGTDYLTGKNIALPYITTARTDATKWDLVANSVAVYAVNVENNTVTLGGISNFGVGLWVDANNSGGNHGSSYNRFFLNAMIDNKIGIKLECSTPGGWVNENQFNGGRFQLSSSYGTTPMWTRHVYVKTWATAGAVSTGAQSMTIDASAKTITMTSTTGLYAGAYITCSGFANSANNSTFQIESLTATVVTLRSTTVGLVSETATATIVTDGAPFSNVPNSNKFDNCSFEGAVEAFIELRGALQHDFKSCRFEPVSGQGSLYFSGMASAAPCKYNRVWGGYSNGGGDFTVKDGSNSYANGGMYSERFACSASGTFGYVQYSNSGSDTYPYITIWPSSATESVLWKPTGTNWHMQVGGYFIDGKAAAVANPQFRLAGQTGRLYLLDGSLAIATTAGSYLDANTGNAGIKQTSCSNMGGGLALGVLNASTATMSGASVTLTINVPAGARLDAVQLRVDTAVTSGTGTSWSAAFSGGSTTSIATGQAFAKSTKVNTILAGTEITTGTTQIVITPNTGTFTGGVIQAQVFYRSLATLAAAP